MFNKFPPNFSNSFINPENSDQIQQSIDNWYIFLLLSSSEIEEYK